MYCIKIEENENGQHNIQSQNHRKTCWLEGYVEVPENLVSSVLSTAGIGELVLEDGVLVDFIPGEMPMAEETPSELEDVMSMLVDQEMRLLQLELGGGL